MNIFVTDADPEVCASHHCDVHVVKMILESAQLLSTAHIVLDENQIAYKRTHQNHPCSIWLRESTGNYEWLYSLFFYLLQEYEKRFNKTHKCNELVEVLNVFPENLSVGGITPFAVVVPDEYKDPDDPCFLSYKNYMKAKMLDWSSREKPLRTSFTNAEVPYFLTEHCYQVIV